MKNEQLGRDYAATCGKSLALLDLILCKGAILQYNGGMASTKQKATRYTAAELSLLEKRLRDYADAVAYARDYAEKAGELYIFKAPTLRRALDALASWHHSLIESMDAAAAGQPLDAESTKSRKKKAAEDLGRLSAAEQAAKYKEERKKR